MHNNAKTAVKIAASFLGCVIGAGFASGQEVLIYFASYGKDGLIGIFICIGLFLLLLVGLNIYILKNRITNFKQFIFSVFDKNTSRLFYILFFSFTYVTYGVMGSGFGAAVNQHTGVSRYIGFVIYLIILSVVLLFDQRGVVWVNLILTPVMIIGILGICLFYLFNMNASTFFLGTQKDLVPYWIISAVLYAGYNSITSIGVICELGSLIRSKKTAWVTALICSITFGMLLVLMNIVLSDSFNIVSMFEIPMLYVANLLNSQIARIYFIVLLMAMLTTGAGCGYVLCHGLNFGEKSSIILLNLASVVFVFFDFNKLVKNLYGFFGIFGTILICVILYRTILTMKNK